MSYDEPESWELCGVSYTAPRMRANEIMLRVMATEEWARYGALKEGSTYGDFDATSPAGRAYCRELVLAYRDAFRKTLEIVKAELGDDG